jgi:hypothetical protein
MRGNRSEAASDALVELTVDRIGGQGDGIAQHAFETVFLPFTVPGDRVRARLGRRRGRGLEARVFAQLVSGPGRADPPCRHFGVRGGCTLQHLDAALYRQVKTAALYGALERVGIDPAVVAPPQVVLPTRRRVRPGLARPQIPDNHRGPAFASAFGTNWSNEFTSFDGCLHWRNLAPCAPHPDYLDAQSGSHSGRTLQTRPGRLPQTYQNARHRGSNTTWSRSPSGRNRGKVNFNATTEGPA